MAIISTKVSILLTGFIIVWNAAIKNLHLRWVDPLAVVVGGFTFDAVGESSRPRISHEPAANTDRNSFIRVYIRGGARRFLSPIFGFRK